MTSGTCWIRNPSKTSGVYSLRLCNVFGFVQGTLAHADWERSIAQWFPSRASFVPGTQGQTWKGWKVVSHFNNLRGVSAGEWAQVQGTRGPLKGSYFLNKWQGFFRPVASFRLCQSVLGRLDHFIELVELFVDHSRHYADLWRVPTKIWLELARNNVSGRDT